ncbi:MAG: prepilin peptidase [Mycoplasmatales bacterium]
MFLKIIYVYLLFLSLVDLKTMHINKWQILGLGIICIPLVTIENLIVAMYVFGILVLSDKFIPDSFGSADIKILTILACAIGLYIIPSILIASIFGIVIIKLIKKDSTKALPFIPLITLGVILCQNLANWMII